MVALPPGVQPQLSPSTAVGEIYRYQLAGATSQTLMDLRVTEDWVLERQFKQIPGVIDVVSFGGPTKEFHVDLDPNKLIAYGLTVPPGKDPPSKSTFNVG